MVNFKSVLPQHGLSQLFGWFAESRNPWLKHFLIDRFVKHYQVDMSLAQIEAIQAYPSFNNFFIRELKPSLRPITTHPNTIACPVDGRLTEFGKINHNQFIQAKKFQYTVDTLLTDKKLAENFYEGFFATFYLSPKDYHRVHMPLTGTLVKTIYVPGKLFSVSPASAEAIPNLFARNERLIALFDTEAGKMAVILIGALIVGHIKMVWQKQALKHKTPMTEIFSDVQLSKGQELGYFKLGSSVIILYENNKIEWLPSIQPQSTVQFGQALGNISQKLLR